MMARRLAIRQGCHVVVTAGELGLWWSDGPAVRRVPAVQVQVRDVCGAGDTVLATMGVVMATGGTIDDACRLAIRMAAEQVGQVGVKSLKSGSNQFPSDQHDGRSCGMTRPHRASDLRQHQATQPTPCGW